MMFLILDCCRNASASVIHGREGIEMDANDAWDNVYNMYISKS